MEKALTVGKRARSNSRVFPCVTAVLALSYHALTAVLCTYLPRDSVVIGYGAAAYAATGCVMSLLGIYGIMKHNRTLTNLFSHSLLLDAFVSTCARLLVLELFFNTTHSQDTCSDIIEAIWTDQRQPSHDVVTSFEWQHSLMRAGVWCRFALGAVHVACVGVLICTSAAQGTVAVAIRNHALQIDNAEEPAADADEKEGLKHSWDVKVDIKEDI